MSEHTIKPRIFGVRSTVCAFIFAFAVVGTALAASAPEPSVARELLEKVRLDMVEALKDPTFRHDEVRIRRLVDDVLVPHVEIEIASRLILTEHWKAASDGQRGDFVNEFRQFLVRFYSAALASYTKNNTDLPDRLMRFSDEIQRKGDRQIIVNSTVNQPVGNPIPVAYRFVLVDNNWKVIDVSVGGVSMIRNYRGSFVSLVEREGFDALLAYLKARNQELK